LAHTCFSSQIVESVSARHPVREHLRSYARDSLRLDAPSAAVLATVLGDPKLAADELHALQTMARTRWLAAGELAFEIGHEAFDLVAVLQGTVGLGRINQGRQFQLERAVHGPQWLDISSVWLSNGHLQDAQALGSALLLELPLTGFERLFVRFPDMRDRMLRAMARAIQSLTGATHDLMAKDAQKRLITFLLQRSTASGADVALRERKRELAAQLAITPETLSRLLRQLIGAGLIEVKGYSIKLIDSAALQRLLGP
jgi:CRP-like cAMP-binding protein